MKPASGILRQCSVSWTITSQTDVHTKLLLKHIIKFISRISREVLTCYTYFKFGVNPLDQTSMLTNTCMIFPTHVWQRIAIFPQPLIDNGFLQNKDQIAS
jgi:hypothetical protein